MGRGPDRPAQVSPSPPQRGLVRLGLWGPPGSGKTTYLAALSVAVNRHDSGGNWIMTAVDEESSEFLSSSTNDLVTHRRFPHATTESKALTFRFTGEIEELPRGRFQRRTPDVRAVSFDLDVIDAPGALYGAPETAPSAPALNPVDGALDLGGGDELGDPDVIDLQESALDPKEALLSHLEDCHGIVFLLDPVREADIRDTFNWFYGMMTDLSRRVFNRPNYAGTRLPQYFAVCVTKFDDINVYKKARSSALIVTDDEPPYLSRVPDEHAEEFFRELCRNSGGNADLVMQTLEKCVAPERLRYFVTSAIGLYVNEAQRFRAHDPSNVTKLHDERVVIRGRVYPINLLEPLLWLERSIRADQQSRP